MEFFETKISTCNENALFAEDKLYELYNLVMKIRRLSVEGLCGEIHFQKLAGGNIFLIQSQKFMSVKLQIFCLFLSSIVQNFHIL